MGTRHLTGRWLPTKQQRFEPLRSKKSYCVSNLFPFWPIFGYLKQPFLVFSVDGDLLVTSPPSKWPVPAFLVGQNLSLVANTVWFAKLVLDLLAIFISASISQMARKSQSNWRASKLGIPSFCTSQNCIKFCKEASVFHT